MPPRCKRGTRKCVDGTCVAVQARVPGTRRCPRGTARCADQQCHTSTTKPTRRAQKPKAAPQKRTSTPKKRTPTPKKRTSTATSTPRPSPRSRSVSLSSAPKRSLSAARKHVIDPEHKRAIQDHVAQRTKNPAGSRARMLRVACRNPGRCLALGEYGEVVKTFSADSATCRSWTVSKYDVWVATPNR